MGRRHIESINIERVSDGRRISATDAVVRETEVRVSINSRFYRRFYLLVTNLEEFALGHVLAEGMARPSQVAVEVAGNRISISSGGGIRRARPQPVASDFSATRQQVCDWVAVLNESCPLFRQTGGTHVVGLFHAAGACIAEDISRHCATDKAIGMALKGGIDPGHGALVASCRQTLSTMRKAVNAGIPLVVTISATTGHAVAEAQRYGITLVGFARGRQFNIYAGGQRIVSR